ncbi:MAG: hypothetical protein ACLTF5_08535 [Butyricicoccus sp.]
MAVETTNTATNLMQLGEAHVVGADDEVLALGMSILVPMMVVHTRMSSAPSLISFMTFASYALYLAVCHADACVGKVFCTAGGALDGLDVVAQIIDLTTARQLTPDGIV